MALTTAPLFSLEASGTIGKTITYSRWHGRAYARRRVIPLNPRTTDQVAARNKMTVLAAGVLFANATALVHPDLTLTDKLEIKAITPSEFAWNGYATEKGIGTNAVTYDAAAAAYTLLQAAEKTAWVAAAAALVPPIPDVPQMAAGGGAAPVITKGQAFFHWVYALFSAGLIPAAPGAVPPTYA